MPAVDDQNNYAKRFLGDASVADFERNIREQESSLFSGALTQLEAEQVFDLSHFYELLSSNEMPMTNIDLFDTGHIIRLSDVLHRTGKSPIAVAIEQLERGATLRIRGIERQKSTIKTVVDSLATVFKAEVSANLYLTPIAREGFRAHFDNTDVFVLQLYGHKDWQLYDHYTNNKALPVRETPWDASRYVPADEGRLVTLNTGDVLYIPRGGMHAAACTVSASMHLTFSLNPTTVLDMITRELQNWADAEVALRRRYKEHDTEQRLPGLIRQLADRLEAGLTVSSANKLTGQALNPTHTKRSPETLGQLMAVLTRKQSAE